MFLYANRHKTGKVNESSKESSNETVETILFFVNSGLLAGSQILSLFFPLLVPGETKVVSIIVTLYTLYQIEYGI